MTKTKPEWTIHEKDRYGPTVILREISSCLCSVSVKGFKWGFRFYADNQMIWETDYIYSNATAAILMSEFIYESILSKKTVEEIRGLQEKYFRGRK